MLALPIYLNMRGGRLKLCIFKIFSKLIESFALQIETYLQYSTGTGTEQNFSKGFGKEGYFHTENRH
jgi:hypothetical protein